MYTRVLAGSFPAESAVLAWAAYGDHEEGCVMQHVLDVPFVGDVTFLDVAAAGRGR